MFLRPAPQIQPRIPFTVEGQPGVHHQNLSDAKCAAARRQQAGERRSLQILQGGKVVDLKRY